MPVVLLCISSNAWSYSFTEDCAKFGGTLISDTRISSVYAHVDHRFPDSTVRERGIVAIINQSEPSGYRVNEIHKDLTKTVQSAFLLNQKVNACVTESNHTLLALQLIRD